MALLEVSGLTKKFDDEIALNDVSLSIEQGKVYGLIGRNGAGKTTFLKLISHIIHQNHGQIKWDTGVVLDTTDIAFSRDYNIYFAGYKLKEILSTASIIYPKYDKNIEEELIKGFQLSKYMKKSYQKCSKGIQTMISLVVAISSNAKVLLLDEPYVGLDPINREFFYKILRKYYFNEEKTVIISSHLINEIEGYFEDIIMIHDGEIIMNEMLDDVYEKSIQISAPKAIVKDWESQLNILGREELAGHVSLYTYGSLNQSVREKIQAEGGTITRMDLQKLMIEMVTGMEGLR